MKIITHIINDIQIYDGGIKRVSVINDTYLIVESLGSVKILDKDFNIIYMHCASVYYDRIGKVVHNNVYYYISEYHNLVSVNLDTMETNVVDLGIEVRGIGCDDESIIFCSERKLYKYTFWDGQCVELYDGIIAGLISIVDGYTYYEVTSLYGCEKYIIDNNGQFISDCTACEKFDMYNFFEVNGVLYSSIDNIGIAAMNPDSSDYREYYFEEQ